MTLEAGFNINSIGDKYEIVAFERGKQPSGKSYEVELVI
jgi:hypothetical protein